MLQHVANVDLHCAVKDKGVQTTGQHLQLPGGPLRREGSQG